MPIDKNIFTIIVTFNGAEWIEKCISSVIEESSVVVIDNGSRDDTISIIRLKFPEVHLVESRQNLGFGGGNNLGIKLALRSGAEYIFLLNQDAWIVEGDLNQIINDGHFNAGILSPIHLSGNKQALDYGFKKYAGNEFTEDYQSNTLSTLYEVSFVNAAAWLIRSKILKKVGGFHPAFHHYGEDLEFVNRLKNAGLKIFISSKCIVCHDRRQERQEGGYFSKIEKKKRRVLVRLLNTSDSLFCNYFHLNIDLVRRMVSSLLKGDFKYYILYFKTWAYLQERFIFCIRIKPPKFN